MFFNVPYSTKGYLLAKVTPFLRNVTHLSMLLPLHEIAHSTNITPFLRTLLRPLESAFLSMAWPSTRQLKRARACAGG